jgi:hypothetical protein
VKAGHLAPERCPLIAVDDPESQAR